jgi:hypothetical protein
VERSQRRALGHFWDWWSTRGAELALTVVETGQPGALSDELSRRLHAVESGLQWELGPGKTGARHALCISAGGVAGLRALAERCVRAAPPASLTWEYLSARAADPTAIDGEMQIGGQRIVLAQLVIQLALAANGRCLDVGVHHGAFASMPSEASQSVAFIALDRLLGEDGVERWVGRIELLGDPPAEALPATALLDAVAELEERETGSAPWIELKAKGRDGAPAVIRARRPMRWIDHPLLEHHLQVTVAYSADGPRGLPDAAGVAALDELVDDLTNQLGDGGLVVARVLSAGRCDVHAYFDQEDDQAFAAARHFSSRSSRTEGRFDRDPGWRRVRAYS